MPRSSNIDPTVIVEMISEACRTRAISHVIMSPAAYDAYKGRLNGHMLNRGIRYATCHGKGILVLPGLTDRLVFTVDGRNEIARLIIEFVRDEEMDLAIEIIEANSSESTPKWMRQIWLKESR